MPETLADCRAGILDRAPAVARSPRRVRRSAAACLQPLGGGGKLPSPNPAGGAFQRMHGCGRFGRVGANPLGQQRRLLQKQLRVPPPPGLRLPKSHAGKMSRDRAGPAALCSATAAASVCSGLRDRHGPPVASQLLSRRPRIVRHWASGIDRIGHRSTAAVKLPCARTLPPGSKPPRQRRSNFGRSRHLVAPWPQ